MLKQEKIDIANEVMNNYTIHPLHVNAGTFDERQVASERVGGGFIMLDIVKFEVGILKTLGYELKTSQAKDILKIIQKRTWAKVK